MFSHLGMESSFTSVYLTEMKLGFLTFDCIIDKLIKIQVVFWNQLDCVLFI